MRRFIVFLMLLTNFTYAQQRYLPRIWRLLIIDSLSKKNIAGATVSLNDGIQLIADKEGAVYITKASVKDSGTISVSCIGYRTFSFVINTAKKLPDSVWLSEATVELKEIKIGQLKKEDLFVLGDLKKKPNTHRITNPREKYVQYIPNERNVRGTIISIEFNVNDILQGIQNPFKIGIYSKIKGDVFPENDLIKDTIIVRNPEKKRLLTIDISQYNVKMPEDGVFVAFETLPASAYGESFVWLGGHKMSKTPGIDMETKKKDDYSADIYDKSDRITPYGMVMDCREEFSLEEVRYRSYLYNEGNYFAISITVQKE